MDDMEDLKRFFEEMPHAKNPKKTLEMAKHFAWYSHESYSKKPIEMAIELLEPHIDDNESPGPELFIYYIKLLAGIGDRNLIKTILKAREILGDEKWCGLFYGKYNISYPAYYEGGQELHTLFCKTCREK